MTHHDKTKPSDAARPVEQKIGDSPRDYPHGSGDRNNKKSESDWKEFEGGKQRDAGPVPDNGST